MISQRHQGGFKLPTETNCVSCPLAPPLLQTGRPIDDIHPDTPRIQGPAAAAMQLPLLRLQYHATGPRRCVWLVRAALPVVGTGLQRRVGRWAPGAGRAEGRTLVGVGTRRAGQRRGRRLRTIGAGGAEAGAELGRETLAVRAGSRWSAHKEPWGADSERSRGKPIHHQVGITDGRQLGVRVRSSLSPHGRAHAPLWPRTAPRDRRA